MKASIVTVGKELLMGHTVNTNLATIASTLRHNGITVVKAYVIDDVKSEYIDVLNHIDENLVVFTGGLGPTADDITKEVVCDYYGIKTVLNQRLLSTIKTYFDRINVPMKKSNIKQAYMPIGGMILDNKVGTAPGVYFTVNTTHIVLLPGPPHEMKPMLNKVMDYLRKHNKKHVYSKGYKLVGIGESTLEEDMHKFYNMNPYVTVAPYASVGEIKYVFSSSNQDDLNDVSNAFLNSYKAYIYGSLEDTLEGVVVSLLASKKLKISVAESCTGGLLASRIVNVSGASSIFEEGYVTYSNSAKQNTLHVTKQTINDHGAVSEQCALEMIGGLVRKTQCDVGVSITGIAGPNGGTEDKPVGLVYFGFYLNGHFFIKKKIFNGTRDIVRYRSTQYALTIIWKELIR